MIVHTDLETRSKIDLTEVGASRYAVDESTEIMLQASSCDDSEEVYLWVNPKFLVPGMESDSRGFMSVRWEIVKPIGERVEYADQICAHNAPFELAMLWRLEIPIDRWRCTAAMARKAGLPSSLEKCAEALGLAQQKDPRGKKLIKFFSVPKDDGTFNEPRDFPEEFKAFGEYCKQDVRTEKAIHRKLKAFELTGFALETFQFDLRMNQRGIPVNVPALRNAQKIIDTMQKEVSEEFRALTGLNPTQRAKVLAWINEREDGLLTDMQSDTVEVAVKTVVSGESKRALELYQKLSYAAIKKVQTMLDCACPDGRVRGCHTYYGASTGRWSGKLIQPQNFKKPSQALKDCTEEAFSGIVSGWNAEDVESIYGSPLDVISSTIRHFIGAPENLDGDYNAIEGRIGCWIAGQADKLEDWRLNRDQYVRAAAFVENVSPDSVQKNSPLRNFGKVIILACQFGLGTEGFMRTCENWGIECDEKKAQRAVHEYYRPNHPKIVERWYLHGAWMLDAIANPGVKAGPWIVKQIAGMKYLLLTLPSGRQLAYPQPEVNTRPPTPKEAIEMANGKNYHPNRFREITYFGQLRGVAWGRVKLHGSLAFQNEVQAIAADVMAHGAIEAEKQGMPIYALIHDQGLAERLNGKTAEDFSRALATLPPWARGLPLKVESKICKYYSK